MYLEMTQYSDFVAKSLLERKKMYDVGLKVDVKG